jgi:hypothetical protein
LKIERIKEKFTVLKLLLPFSDCRGSLWWIYFVIFLFDFWSTGWREEIAPLFADVVMIYKLGKLIRK